MTTEFRPKSFAELEGQDNVKAYLQIQVTSYRKTRVPAAHMLFLGASGVGKTTLANVYAAEVRTGFHYLKATELGCWGDLIGIIYNQVKEGDVVFIDEIHALKRDIQEKLYGVLEDFEYLGKDNHGNVSKGKLPRFTMIGATTHEGELQTALLGRFDYRPTLVSYNQTQLTRMIQMAGKRIYNIDVPNAIASKLAGLSQGTARRAYALLRSMIVVANGLTTQRLSVQHITEGVLNTMLLGQDIDPIIGLERSSRQYLMALYRSQGRALGKGAISTLLSKEEGTITHTIEPFLMSEDLQMPVYTVLPDGKFSCRVANGPLVKATERGRMITELGIEYLRMCRECQTNYNWFAGERFV